MSTPPPSDALVLAYEALRAQATGTQPASAPRGLALVQTAGLTAWMEAWTPLAPPPRAPSVRAGSEMPVGLGRDVVRLLTEMVVGWGRRLTTT